MNIIKEWWRCGGAVLIHGCLVALIVLCIAKAIAAMFGVEPGRAEPGDDETVRCECKCNHP